MRKFGATFGRSGNRLNKQGIFWWLSPQDSNGNLAVKLLRTYTMQMEALQRYRGKGGQKMTVEHVHVYQGGQAIVGAVHQGGGPRTKTEEQPHAQAITHEPGAALPCPDPQREAVPIAGGEG